ncbi:hypothetical protein, partial [Pantoea agglomerans]|uniref:hypothetical protein n=1 Tax=Enterobacter agglomerans TaxID=549 RepID=UPI003C798777
VARPEIPHPLSGSDGLPTPSLLSFLLMLGTLSLWGIGIASDFWLSRQNVIQPARCYLCFLCRVLYRCGFWDCLGLLAQQTECYSTCPLLSLLVMSGTLSLWFFGIASGFRLSTQNGIQT